jgi:hypothetical protein
MTAAWPRVPAAAEVCTIVLGFALASTMPVLAADAETPSADSGYVDRLIDPDTADQLYADKLRD